MDWNGGTQSHKADKIKNSQNLQNKNKTKYTLISPPQQGP